MAERAFAKVIQRGMDDDTFREVDPKVATLAILGAVNWTVKWFRPGGSKSAGEIGTEFAEQMVRGLMAPGVELQVPDLELPDLVVPKLTDLG